MIVAIWAEEKAWKSTMALSWPKPIKHYDLDVGGFARAIWRIDPTDIESKAYPTPIQMNKLMGQTTEGVTINFPKKLMGIKETLQRILIDFMEDCQNKKVITIIMDSATQLWTITHRSRLQELQEIQVFKKPGINENELREKLQQFEYGEPNDRMRTLIYAARSYGKNLILTHYPKAVYAEAMTPDGPKSYKVPGQLEPDGFGETERLADIVIKNTVAKDNKVTATITRCGLPGLGSMVTGLSLSEPSYQGLQKLAESMGAEIQ